MCTTEKGKKKDADCCGMTKGCCKVDAVVAIDERGQIILPKDIRDKAKVKPGDKFAIISCESGGKVGCISMVKVDDLADTIKDMLGPMMKEIFK